MSSSLVQALQQCMLLSAYINAGKNPTLSGVQGWTDNLGHAVTFASIVFAPVICFGARIRVKDSGIGREVSRV